MFVSTSREDVTIVAVYVDDLVIVTKTLKSMEKIKKDLTKRFRMKDLRKLHHCLGITVEYDKRRGVSGCTKGNIFNPYTSIWDV